MSCSHRSTDKERALPLLGHGHSPRQLPRWTKYMGSSLHNYHVVYVVFLHLVITFLLVILLTGNTIDNGSLANYQGTWSPAKESVQYKIHRYYPPDNDHVSVYGGEPTIEQDAAWNNMFSSMYFAASSEEILKAGGALVNGLVEVTSGGYLATLGVYHELHCVRQLRLYLYEDRYYHNLTDRQRAYNRKHLDHCLEVLRISTMCHGNADMFLFKVESSVPRKPSILSSAESLCIDWSSLGGWSTSRQLGVNQTAVPPSSWNLTRVPSILAGSE
ncbi:hypothetical protein F4678DRAFT_456568 [Xylaria arbuscula]|nr:hypothetical protein F4678DRAFT_456568 [Xylaria arbuscula]